MWNEPSKELLARLPRLYETEGTELEDKIIHLHFFMGGCHWYIAEYDGDDIFFGYANLNDPEMAEWGYLSFQEFKDLQIEVPAHKNGRLVGNVPIQVDRELPWRPKKFSEITKL